MEVTHALKNWWNQH